MFVAEVPIVVKNFRNTFRKILNSSWELIMFKYFLAVYDKTMVRKTWSNYLISDDGDTAVSKTLTQPQCDSSLERAVLHFYSNSQKSNKTDRNEILLIP